MDLTGSSRDKSFLYVVGWQGIQLFCAFMKRPYTTLDVQMKVLTSTLLDFEGMFMKGTVLYSLIFRHTVGHAIIFLDFYTRRENVCSEVNFHTCFIIYAIREK